MWNTIKFYNLMHYPVPKNSNLYQYISENWNSTETSLPEHKNKDSFSRSQKCELMDEYIEYINQWSWIFKYIPCIRQVYLCNSITFNALHKNSDIDLCIITRSGYLRFARLFSWIVIKVTWLKREKGKFNNNNRKKFCLSFYIDEEHTDIYHLRKRQGDVYLSYWLAHTILLYSDGILSDNHLIEYNKKLLSYLPHHPSSQSIVLGNNIIRGSSYSKKIMEWLVYNRLGRLLQHSIWVIRWRWIGGYKKSRLSNHTQKEIIISSTMLKFHEDKRDIVQHKRKTTTRDTL
jgi:predicted nucleotidyltransferase